MKKIIIVLSLLLTHNFAYSVDPVYTLKIHPVSIGSGYTEFDIFLKHENPAQTTFYYSMGQYVIEFDPVLLNTGTFTYEFSQSSVSDLPVAQRPLNPTIAGNELRLASNIPPQVGTEYVISSTGAGTRIARMRFSTSSNNFRYHNYALFWKNVNHGGFYTKIFAYSPAENLLKNITSSSWNKNFPVEDAIGVITGNIFVDFNYSNVRDWDEPPYRAILGYNPGPYVSSDYFGYFVRYITSPGTTIVSIARGVPSYFSTQTFAVTYPGSSSHTFLFMPLQAISSIDDMQIFAYGGPSRPGFEKNIGLTIINNSTTNKSGTVEFIHDANYSYINSYPTHASYNSTTKTITWNYIDLNPSGYSSISIRLMLSNVMIGTPLQSTAKVFPVSGDISPLNNIFLKNEIAGGSFDPNDKTVEPAGKITNEDVINEDSLTYTIRFQNTGTDTAFTVRILDTLSSMLNLETIELLGSSHEFSFSMDENGIAEWIFDNILLPDSTTNEPLSHGFLSYRVKPKTTLVVGDSIKNTAHIYFDFNEPVATNTVVTAVVEQNNILDLTWRLEALYPVPDFVTVQLRNSTSPYDLVDSANVFGDIAGPAYHAVMEFAGLESGSDYYVVVRHRNSLETWSASPVTFNTDTMAYDFTTSLTQAFGNNMIIVDNTASFYSGDVNQDGTIELSDVLLIFNDVSNFTTGITDLNGNGSTDLSDLLIAYNNSKNFVHVISP